MMRPFVTLLVAFACVVAMAQKPNINKAKTALNKGELVEAKTIIDQAIDHEKTKGKAKTWYYRGQIYATLDTANNEPDALETAMEAFNKTLEIDSSQSTISEFTVTGVENVDSKLQDYYAHYYNSALEKWQMEEFTLAADDFEKAFYIMPSDTNAIINAAFAATAAEEDERAKDNYLKSLDAGVKDKNVYLRLYNYAIEKEDLDNALSIISDAKKIYPNDLALQKFEINILIQQEKVDEAKAKLESAIEKESGNPDLHFSLGVIKEEQDDIEGANKSYLKAIEVDPNHYNSNFNIGVMIFNECTGLIKERNALSYKEEKKYDDLTQQINQKLHHARPYWEKLYNLKSDDQTILETLSYIYVNLKMNDQAEKISTELDAVLQGEGE